jgi:hypothetical protein
MRGRGDHGKLAAALDFFLNPEAFDAGFPEDMLQRVVRALGAAG